MLEDYKAPRLAPSDAHERTIHGGIEVLMSSIVLDLQQELITGNCDVMSALRKAHLIASKLHLSEFDRWIQSELNGYTDRESIPDYRRVGGVLKAQNPYQGWVPAVIQDSELESIINSKKLPDSIGDLIELSKKDSGTLALPVPGAVAKRLDEWCGAPFPTNYAVFFGIHKINSILESVINHLLNWTIELESQGILGDGLQFNDSEKVKAASVPQTVNNYYAPAHVENAPIDRSAVVAGDKNTVSFSYEAARTTTDRIETAIKADVLSDEYQETALELLYEIRDKIAAEKKPNLIKAAFSGLREFLISAGAGVAAEYVLSVIHQLF